MFLSTAFFVTLLGVSATESDSSGLLVGVAFAGPSGMTANDAVPLSEWPASVGSSSQDTGWDESLVDVMQGEGLALAKRQLSYSMLDPLSLRLLEVENALQRLIQHESEHTNIVAVAEANTTPAPVISFTTGTVTLLTQIPSQALDQEASSPSAVSRLLRALQLLDTSVGNTASSLIDTSSLLNSGISVSNTVADEASSSTLQPKQMLSILNTLLGGVGDLTSAGSQLLGATTTTPTPLGHMADGMQNLVRSFSSFGMGANQVFSLLQGLSQASAESVET